MGPSVLRSDAKGLAAAAEGLARNAFNGAAAVVVFFLISGFCIHYPQRISQAIPSYRAFYLRRYLRTVTPMVVAILLAAPLQLSLTSTILWSLIAEEIYYLIYPFLLSWRKRFGWRSLLTVASICSTFVIWRVPVHDSYWGYGWQLTWIVGLPCWLLGCYLAERADRLHDRTVTGIEIWSWRFGMWVAGSSTIFLAFHSVLPLSLYLNIFGVLAFFWLEKELIYFRHRSESPLLAKLGEASYSIYLMHTHGPAIVYAFFGIHWWTGILPWLTSLGVSGVVSFIFYLLVEHPSHRLARSLSRAMAAKPAVPAMAV
jgi:peptidoglycan/LPS O-acetylase OafA/YrhL